MYMPYLMYGYAATAVLLLLGCRVCARTVPGLRGLRLLSWAVGCGLLSVVLMALRPYAPAWVSVLLANEALFLYVLLLYCAAADTLVAPMRFLPWGVGVALAALAGNTYFTYAHPALTPRILIGSGSCTIYAAAMAILFWRHVPTEDEISAAATLRSLTKALASLQALTVALHLVRCTLTLLYPPSGFLHLDVIQAGFTYANMLVDEAAAGGVLWLAVWQHRRELQRLAMTDSLTGLLNRRAFEDILAREMRRASHTGKSVAVLLLDIDHFKEVNDSLGHHAGDEVIRRVSMTLRGGMRPDDALARYGGEEFVMLLRHATEEQMEGIAWRLRADIADLSGLPDGIKVTVSIGAAASHPPDTPEQILRRCDDALYRSKREGRNLVTVNRCRLPGPVAVSRAL